MSSTTWTAATASAHAERMDRIFKALASKPRREILELLASGAARDDERCCSTDEVCACVFSERLGLGAPTVSHHTKVLLEAGLISADKRGQWVYYRLEPGTVSELIGELSRIAGRAAGTCS